MEQTIISNSTKNLNVYLERNGRNLLNSENFPPEVANYLLKEKNCLSLLKQNFKVLIEVGCFSGTYLQFCDKNKKKYIGIDINLEYLFEGNRRANFFNIPKEGFEFHNLNAQNLIDIKSKSKIFQETAVEDILVLFPFNCLGNIANYQAVIDSLISLGLPFFVSNFNTTLAATQARETYYNNCDYECIEKHITNDGVRFDSSDGLNTIAYDLNFLINNFILKNQFAKILHINGIGIGIINLNKNLDIYPFLTI